MASSSSSSDPGVVRVWHADVAEVLGRDADAVTRALVVLTAADRERYDRFRQEADRHMFLLGRVMARAVVADALGLTPAGWGWREGLRGRPEVDRADCDVSFNLAHSAGVVVCALSRCGPVGVDVEHRDRARIDHGLVPRCCAPDETDDVLSKGDGWRDRFLQYWTLKESYLKAVGLGISVNLPDVRFVDLDDRPHAAFTGSLAGADDGWVFDLAPLEPRHYVAVAMSTVSVRSPRLQRQRFPETWWP